MEFEYFEHTADMGLCSKAQTLEMLFINMATGIINYITDVKQIQNNKSLVIKAEGIDKEDLLINWLKTILEQFNLSNFLTSKIIFLNFDINNFRITAKIWGDDDLDNYNISGEIKAITYHNVSIESDNNKYSAKVIFDI